MQNLPDNRYHGSRGLLQGLLPTLAAIFMVFFFAGSTLADTGQDPNPAKPASTGPDLETVLTGIEQRYSGRDFTADFFQTSLLAAIDITETAEGKAWFSHPGKMRWEYHRPEKQEIITNGTTLWIYRTEENQVVQGDAVSFFKSGGGGAFLADINLIREGYEITLDRVETDFVTLVLVPKIENPEISSIGIRVLRNTFDIDRVETTNIYGDTTTLEFKAINFHTIDRSLFEFVIPQGTDLLFMDPSAA